MNNSKFNLHPITAALISVLALQGCATQNQKGEKISIGESFKQTFASDDPCSNNARNIGLAVGVLAGAVLGHQVQNDNTGTLVGAALGAGVGGLIGHSMDTRRCELSKIAKANNLTLASAAITQDKLDPKAQGGAGGSSTVGLDVIVKNDGEEFEPNSSVLTPKARKAYGEIADQYKPDVLAVNADANTKTSVINAAKQRKVLIVGHADESGDPAKLAKLSEARAKAVAEVFAAHGVSASNIYYQGAGNTLPVASNATEKGSAENRRVQIVDVPSEANLKQYLSLRAPDPRNFAAATGVTQAPTLTSKNDVSNDASVLIHSTHKGAPAIKKHKSKTADTVASVEATAADPRAYDFGGRPDLGKDTISLGAPIHTSMFNFISTANAAEPVIMDSCRKDHPHVSTDVHNLATGAKLAAMDNSNFITGLYGAPIAGVMNGNSIFILHPYAAKDAGIPTPEPTFQIYRKDENGNGNKPLFSKVVPVNVYRGSNATLYRMFVGGSVGCMDMVVRSDDVENAGRLYYQHDGQAYVAQGKFVASK